MTDSNEGPAIGERREVIRQAMPAIINWMCPLCGAPNAAQAGADMPEKCRACSCGIQAPDLLGGTE